MSAAVSEEAGRLVPILLDLRGLKLRTGPLAGEERVPIARGSTVEIVNKPVPTTTERIGIDYEPLFEVIQPGSRILISDGLIELLVEQHRGRRCDLPRRPRRATLGRQGVTLARGGRSRGAR